MTKTKKQLLIDLATELYIEENKKSGLLESIPYAYLEHHPSGTIVAVSIFAKHSNRLKIKLKDLDQDL